jgi:hypothetical protein
MLVLEALVNGVVDRLRLAVGVPEQMTKKSV